MTELSTESKVGDDANHGAVHSAPTTRRRVLMLCYYFPPIQTSGTQRSVRFANHLPSFGWDPIILTVSTPKDRWITVNPSSHNIEHLSVERAREFDLAGIVRVLHGVTNRLVKLFGGRLTRNHFADYLCIPDAQVAWLSLVKAIRLARSCDCIYVSCTPFSAALTAVLAKKITKKPLVVDFRDVWARYYRDMRPPLHAWAIGKLERWVIRNADHLVVNTHGAARLYREDYPTLADHVSAIPNSYDELRPAPPVNDDDRFRILHVGTFYRGRSPVDLLEVLADLNDSRIEFVQIGEPSTDVESFADRLDVRQLGQVSREQALELMESASLLYSCQMWLVGGKVDNVAVAAKTYEYLATGLPILAHGPPGDNADVVERFARYGYVVRDRSHTALKAAVLKAIEDRGRRSPQIDDDYARTYHPVALTERLANIMNTVCEVGT